MLREIELQLGSAGGFSGKKKRKHCIILLLITTPGTTYSFKAKEGKSAVYQNQK
jgi:prolyl oligopeptidase